MDDLKERLRWCSDLAEFEADIMSQWDRWRKMIADGHKGSLPRDQFEALVFGFLETHADALARIEELERGNKCADDAVDYYKQTSEKFRRALKPFVDMYIEIEFHAKQMNVAPDAFAKSCTWNDLLQAKNAYFGFDMPDNAQSAPKSKLNQ